MKQISASAFSFCKHLELIKLPEDSNLECIGPWAFCGTAIKTFSAPSHLRVIEQSAFFKCTCLETVILNEGIERIGDLHPEEDDPGIF